MRCRVYSRGHHPVSGEGTTKFHFSACPENKVRNMNMLDLQSFSDSTIQPAQSTPGSGLSLAIGFWCSTTIGQAQRSCALLGTPALPRAFGTPPVIHPFPTPYIMGPCSLMDPASVYTLAGTLAVRGKVSRFLRCFPRVVPQTFA